MLKKDKFRFNKFFAVFLTSLLVLQTAFFNFNISVFAAEDSTDDEGLVIEGDIDLFQAEYKNEEGEIIVKSSDGSNVIAPGTSWEDSFDIVNKHDKTISYTFNSYLTYKSEFGTTKLDDLAMEFKLLKDGKYLAGDDDTWVKAKDFKVSDSGEVLETDARSTYEVKWQWPFEDSAEQDLKDTLFGNDFNKDGKSTLTIHFEAVASERDVPPTATVTGRTIHTLTFIPEKDQEYSIDAGKTWRKATAEELQNKRMSYVDLDEFTDYNLINRYFETPELDPSSPAHQVIKTRAVNAKEIGEAFVNNDGSTKTSGSNLDEIASNGYTELFVNHDGNYEIRLTKNINHTVNIPNNWEDITLDMNDNTINGPNGKNGTDGEIGMDLVKGTHHTELGTQLVINGPGVIKGGNGANGYNEAGNGATALKVESGTNSTINLGQKLEIYGGNGGTAKTGNAGKGGIGVEANIETTKAIIHGGDGGTSTKGNGGIGGAGVKGDIKENDGKIYGGNGGDSYDGNGGDGGAGVIGDIEINRGEIYGGNGGDSENGKAGKGGDGLIGHVEQNYGIIKAGKGGHDNQDEPGPNPQKKHQADDGKDIRTGDFTTVLLYVIPIVLVVITLLALLVKRKKHNE